MDMAFAPQVVCCRPYLPRCTWRESRRRQERERFNNQKERNSFEKHRHGAAKARRERTGEGGWVSVDVQVSLSLYIYIRTLTQPLSASQESLDFEILSSSLLGYAALRLRLWVTDSDKPGSETRIRPSKPRTEAERQRSATESKGGRKGGKKKKDRPSTGRKTK